MLKHGGARGGKSAEYKIWTGIKKRCFNQKTAAYKHYGGRGITMHTAWINSFEEFFAWVGQRPSPEHSIDRYPDNDGDYEPGNVRWATDAEQANNKRNTLFLEYNGERKTLGQWAEEKGIPYITLWMRIDAGRPLEKLFAPRYECVSEKRFTRMLKIGDREMSITQWTKESGLPRGVIAYRLDAGWDPETVLAPAGKYAGKR